jgi:predicted SprT family Zn-dependent metalloprotease
LEQLFAIPQADPEQRLQLLYDRLAGRFHFGPALVRLSTRKLTGGEIQYGPPHRITISAHLSESEQEDTLRHEAAHAWAFASAGSRVAHGPVFRRLARLLGAKPGHAPETPALRDFRRHREILYCCEGCRQVFRRMRPFRRRTDCLKCWRTGAPSRLRKWRVTSDE